MRIAVFCATRRGLLFLQKIISLAPEADLVVFSFKEESWEPPFFDQIQALTLAHGGRFIEAKQVGASNLDGFWNSMTFDLMFVVSWRYLIPPGVYEKAQIGTFVFHDSLLPKYRGFSPTVWAIINGEEYTGVTIFKIAAGVDTGDIVDQQTVSIGPDETIAEVIERVTETYLSLLERNWDNLCAGSVQLSPQDHTQTTYTCKRLPEDNQIDWGKSSKDIFNLIRAVTKPYPGAFTYLSGQKLYIWSAQLIQNESRYIGRIPGRVIEVLPDIGSIVLTGSGALLVKDVQLEDKSVVCASRLLNRLSQTLVRCV